MHSRVLITLLVGIGLVLAPATSFAKKKNKRLILVYNGELQDERKGTISGVFPLTFALYKKARGGKAVWSESHFVGVDQGKYVVELGRKNRISNRVGMDQLYVGVRITGGPELVRERFVPAGEATERLVHQAGKKQPKQNRPGNEVVAYAEKAGFAYTAEKAENAVRLDGFTLEQIKGQLGGAVGINLSKNTVNSEIVGGQGGSAFSLKCPADHVVIGIQGHSGAMIDSIQVICAPLSKKK